MAYRTFDYYCDLCGFSEIDMLVEEGEEPDCPECANKLTKKIPLLNFQFGTTYFAGMSPRRVEVKYHQHDGSTITKNITHQMPTDISQPGD